MPDIQLLAFSSKKKNYGFSVTVSAWLLPFLVAISQD